MVVRAKGVWEIGIQEVEEDCRGDGEGFSNRSFSNITEALDNSVERPEFGRRGAFHPEVLVIPTNG